MRAAAWLTLMLAGCRAPAPAPAPPVSPAPSLPCGASQIEDLAPTGRTHVGSCTVVTDGTYDQLREDGRLVMRGGDGKPLIAYDPRIPGPAGLRVGMTGAEVEAATPAYRHIECHASADLVQCELRRVASPPDCGGDPDDTIYVELARPPGMPDGGAAWSSLRAHALTAVILTMPC